MPNLQNTWVPPPWLVWMILSFTILLILISIYGTAKLIKHRNDSFMTKRFISVVFGLNISFILGMMAHFAIIYSQFLKNRQAFTISIAIFFISWFLMFTFLNVKNSLQYFRYKWQYYTLQLQWQQLINPNIVQKANQNNWYIRNNNIYGNLSFMYKLFGSFHLIIFIFCIIMMIVRVHQIGPAPLRQWFGIIIIINFLIPFFIYSYIICKTPSFNDIFYIHWESKMHAIIIYILIIGYLAGNITITIHGKATLMDSVIYCTIRTLAYFLSLCVSTFIMIYRNRKRSTNLKSPLEECSNVSMDSQVHIGLIDILSNAQSLHLFMIHLSREFSMECLLSVLEFNQFERYLLQQMEQTTSLNIPLSFQEPSNIPISMIIETDEVKENNGYDNDDVAFAAKMKAYKLYAKYIKIGSEFEINISGTMRDQVISMLDDVDDLMRNIDITFEDILLLFTEIKQEMQYLLLSSFNRFKEQSEYAQVVALFVKGTSLATTCKNLPESPISGTGANLSGIDVEVATIK